MVVDGVEKLVLLLFVDGSWFVSVVGGVGLRPGMRFLFSSATDSCLVLLFLGGSGLLRQMVLVEVLLPAWLVAWFVLLGQLPGILRSSLFSFSVGSFIWLILLANSS